MKLLGWVFRFGIKLNKLYNNKSEEYGFAHYRLLI